MAAAQQEAQEQEKRAIAFGGSKAQREQAERIFNIFRARGMFMSENSTIQIPLDTLTAFLEQQNGTKPAETVKVLGANSDIFAIRTIESHHFEPAPAIEDAAAADGAEDETDEAPEPAPPVEIVTETTWVMTTRAGKAPVDVQPENTHNFAQRLMTPEPKIERPAEPVRERPRVDPSWATYTIPEGLELETEEEVVEAEETPPAVEPVTAPAEAAVSPEPEIVEAPAPVETPAPVEAAAAAEEVVEEAQAPAASGVLDISGYSDDAIAAAIENAVGTDARAALFGSLWMSEDRVPRLSRGDLRRIKEYIEEQEQPLTDATLVQDILNVRPNSVEFPVLQFAMNYRLSKEHRDFEFVGTNDQRFWNTSTAPQLGTTRRKPNEIGTDYRYLVEQVGVVEPRSVSSIDHVLTFYEFTLGLLPFDEQLQSLLPAPLTPDQKSAVLTFEFPQAYATYLVELRYPTPNRGGFLLGLDDFYADNLVPGAMISISATESDGHYKVEFLPGDDQTARLLELDDRRSPRYLFRPTTYSCVVDDAWLISEDRFPRLGTEKPLDDRVRRRPEAVVEATFQRVGDQNGDRWTATFDDLLPAVNVERPFSRELLQATLEQDAGVTDEGSDTFTYASES